MRTQPTPQHPATARLAALIVIVSLLVAATAAPALAAGPAGNAADLGGKLAPHAPGVLLVGFRPGAAASDRAAARASVRAAGASALSPLAPDAERWELPDGADLGRAIEALERNPFVRFAEPDYLLTSADVSNDPYYTNGSLWGMHGDGIASGSNRFGTGADEAWAMGYTGSRSIAIGVIDEGFQYTHPELADNTWTNAAEEAGVAGVDDDGNGYIDDLHGWDFYSNDSSTYDGTGDDHGTHVSGTIGGLGGNGIGVAGVNWQVTLVSGKFLGSNGGYTSGAIAAVDYMTWVKVHTGLNIVATSNSWGGGGFSQALLDAINRGGDANILFIAAAGNSSSNNDGGAYYPSNYQCTNGGTRGWDCVVAVAAIDSAGSLASFSSYGATTVDLGAPGVGVQSSVPTDSYASYSGTSMATPHVSGAAALCASVNPSLTAGQLKSALLASAVSTASLSGKTLTGGRLDVGALPGLCQPATAPPVGTPTGLVAATLSTSSIALTWTDGVTGESAYEIQRAPGTLAACGTYATIGSTRADAVSYTVTGLAASTDYCFRVRATNTYNGTSATAWSSAASARTNSPPAAYQCRAVGYDWIDPTGGTVIVMSDDSSSARTLPFTFTAYGTAYTGITVSSNGFVRLGTGSATEYSNVGIPNIGEPNAIVAAAWDDWNPGVGGSVSVKTVGTAPTRSYVVSWVDVPNFNVTGSAASFQVILEEGGDVVRLQYRDMVTGSTSYDRGASATAGIEGATGEWGTQVAFNQAILTDGTAYRCSASAGLPPTISSTSYPDGTTGVAYSTTLAATDGTAPYLWAIASGALPAGLTLNAATGVIAGTPTTAATASFTVSATGADGGTASRAGSIRIGAPLAISTSSLATAAVGAAYSATLAATGGTTPITWAITAGALPDGLTLNGTTGAISGTPTVGGTTTFTVTATDAASPVRRTAARELSILVGVPAVITGPTSFADATTGVAYATTLTATGTSPFAWSIASGALPAGISLDGATGVIAGIPTGAGTASFSVRVTAADGATATRAGAIKVADPLAIATTTLPGGSIGTPYAESLAAIGGTTPLAWSLGLGATLPDGLALNGATGTISGTPTTAGTATFTVVVTDAAVPTARVAVRQLSIVVGASVAIAAPATFPDGTTGTAYRVALATIDGTAPFTWSIVGGSLPAGVTLDTATGEIAGTPTTAATSSFTVKVSGADGGIATANGSIRVDAPLAITATTIPTGTAGNAYSTTLATSGGRAPIAWTLEPGSTLPAGLSLSGATISGTPTIAGSFTVTLRATDDARPVRRTATRTITLAIGLGKRTPANNTTVARATSTSAEWYPHATATSYRYCWATSTKGCTNWTTTSGVTATLTGLAFGKNYSWQVQALVGGTWVAANGGSLWKFSVPR